jgi:hypothetical protein
MKWTFASLALATSLLATPVTAAEIKGCYSVTYSKAHMQAHPGQTPRFLSVRIRRVGADTIFEVGAKLRGKTGKWTEGGNCSVIGTRLDCGVECDGGGFVLRKSGNNLRLINSRGFRVAREACNGEVIAHMIQPVPGNRRFTLFKRYGNAACQ